MGDGHVGTLKKLVDQSINQSINQSISFIADKLYPLCIMHFHVFMDEIKLYYILYYIQVFEKQTTKQLSRTGAHKINFSCATKKWCRLQNISVFIKF